MATTPKSAAISHVGTAGDILFVPEQKVEFVLLADTLQEPTVRIADRLAMPQFDGLAMQLDDLGNVDHLHSWGHSRKGRILAEA